MLIRYPVSGIRYPVIFGLSVIRTVIRATENPVSAHPWCVPTVTCGGCQSHRSPVLAIRGGHRQRQPCMVLHLT
ncbi:hypothetical protein Y032_0179g698 [Ancylostoma ceylanicum]|uniref:Uncharacterized protein n=1 Tax=Ancylostoma ceylanicum TaxID=53326 RepID=A0A016STJ4_9BILA|nr:hypothetical protein Y032_0179g698 [Ancylostoma ceylanicum]